jgi:elongation factor Ts
MAISAEMAKELREKTGAGMMECKKALEQTEGDMNKAVTLLRERGVAVAARREAKATNEGTVGSYIHHNGGVGVLVELNCETAPVARTEDFQTLARDIAMQIAWGEPQFINREEVPESVLETEKDIYRQQAIKEGKPEQAIEKIIAGRLEKYYSQIVLMDQPFIRDSDITIKDHITQAIGKIGEKIQIRRFVRYRVGEEIK